MTDDHTHRGDDVHSVEAAEREANGGWQPIATAPKDGARYLVYQPEHKKGRSSLMARICFVENAGWVRESTHWMPLPAAPTEGE
jgi:hypothetical protein